MSKKLTTENWDNSTPGKIRELVSMCTKTNPEVGKKVLDKIPNLTDYGKELSNSVIKSNDASTKAYFDIAMMRVESEKEARRSEAENEKKRQENIGKILEDDKLSSEEKNNFINLINESCKSYNDQDSEHSQNIKEVEENADRKDRENRDNNNAILQWGLGAVLLAFGWGVEYKRNKNQNDRT